MRRAKSNPQKLNALFKACARLPLSTPLAPRRFIDTVAVLSQKKAFHSQVSFLDSAREPQPDLLQSAQSSRHRDGARSQAFAMAARVGAAALLRESFHARAQARDERVAPPGQAVGVEQRPSAVAAHAVRAAQPEPAWVAFQERAFRAARMPIFLRSHLSVCV